MGSHKDQIQPLTRNTITGLPAMYDSPLCHELLAKKILPVVRYYSYIEITRRAHQTLWREYEHLQATFDNFAMQHIRDQEDIYPVFRELFHKQSSKSEA